MKVYRRLRYELDLNNEQRSACVRNAGVARWAYNFGLQRKMETRESGQKLLPSAWDLSKEITRLKRSSHRWLREISVGVYACALNDLDVAFKKFFSPEFPHHRHPKFKSKKSGRLGFRLKSLNVQPTSRAVYAPKIGWLRTKEEMEIRGRVLQISIKERAGRWFATLSVEMDIAVSINDGPPVGVDLGIKNLATLSDGSAPIPNPKAFTRELKKLRRLKRSFSRRQKGSNRREKMKKRIAHLHYRTWCVRMDTLHKLTTRLAKTHGAVGIEDLGVSKLVKNRRLSRAISDCGWSEFRRQLVYKCEANGSTLVVHDRFYPSSKKCSRCGRVKDVLRLDERTYRCEACGLKIDRDLNAAMNLEPPGGTRRLDVDGKALTSGKPDVKPARMKRQPSVASRKASE